jgi:hypothetical protein
MLGIKSEDSSMFDYDYDTDLKRYIGAIKIFIIVHK